MNITRKYKVAGHVFSMTLPDSEKLWNILDVQYAPFRVEDNEAALFSVSLVNEMEENPERKCVYDVPTEDGETVVKLYREKSGWLFALSPDHNFPIVATVRSDENFSKAELALSSRKVSDALFGINNAAMLMFAFATAPLHTLEMHASVILNSGKAYLFLGKSGTGKSTHSSLWLKYVPGSVLMNDDNPVIRVDDNGNVIAYGSPWSGKTPCYKNLEAPVGAFVRIRQCPENKIARCSILEAYSNLYSSVSGIKDEQDEMSDHINSSFDKVLSSVPMYVLDCRPDEEAARLCSETVR